ncbi:MAG: hypothetical protein ABII76_26020, partial [Pseudomonadota bacterium]
SEKVNVIRQSDNLLLPQKYVAEIREHPDGRVEYAIQFVGRDEGKEPTWLKTASVRSARKAIKKAIREHV